MVLPAGSASETSLPGTVCNSPKGVTVTFQITAGARMTDPVGPCVLTVKVLSMQLNNYQEHSADAANEGQRTQGKRHKYTPTVS